MTIDRTTAVLLVVCLACLVGCAFATGEHAAAALGAIAAIATSLSRSLVAPRNSHTESVDSPTVSVDSTTRD